MIRASSLWGPVCVGNGNNDYFLERNSIEFLSNAIECFFKRLALRYSHPIKILTRNICPL